MKMNIRFLSFLLACLFCAGSLFACSGGNEQADGTTPSDTTAPSESDKWPQVEGTVIYVDASAEEGGDGSKDSPLRSIYEAQEKVRDLKSGTLPEGGITVLFAAGEYSVTDTVNFTAEDSGTEDCPITYMSAEKHGAVFTGGITLDASDFTALDDEEKALLIDDTAKNKVLKLDLAKYGLTADDIGKIYPQGNDSRSGSYPGGVGVGSSELFIGGERMELSRYPNASLEDPYLRVGDNDNELVFNLKEVDLERIAKWDTEDIWLVGFLEWAWSSGILPVESIDTTDAKVTLAHRNHYGLNDDGRLFFINVFAETDEAGEYYIDREKNLLYVYPTDDFNSTQIVLSRSDKNIISISDASYITFDGFGITATRADGIMIRGDHVTVENCNISCIRGDAIDANGSNITIQNNEIGQIGDSAIIIYGGSLEKVIPSGNMIYNNHIHHWNQLSKSHGYAVIINGCGTTLSHNEMHDAPHQAVIWHGPNHIMEYNEVYNVCTTTSDCGAFYSGRRLDCYGSTVRYNYIHDVGFGSALAVGIYYDDGLGGQIAYGNIISNTSGHGMLIGSGRDNVIENNLIINWNPKCSPISYDGRTRTFPTDVYEHAVDLAEFVVAMQAHQEWLDAFPGYGDIIPFTEGYDGDYEDPLLSTNPANNIVRNNMFFSTLKGYYTPMEYAYAVFKFSTFENNLQFSDIDLVQLPGYNEGDCTLAEDSEPYKNGFVKIPLEEIGLVTNE
ncbi:MAG: right-handed parallel beta-helix repeat-containing protein [Clostridia bacterium]|nr:right-handed parallel beta-helix repeat-containing protein [Clostridia bacterium]